MQRSMVIDFGIVKSSVILILKPPQVRRSYLEAPRTSERAYVFSKYLRTAKSGRDSDEIQAPVFADASRILYSIPSASADDVL